MGVPFYNFADLHHKQFKEEVKKRIGEIIDTNAFVEGEYNTKFEKEFAQLQGVKHCLLVANGTDALEISLKAHGIGPGDKVGVGSITFYASAEAIINVGATPVWVDVNSRSGLMCPESLKRVNQIYKLDAVMPIHIYGLPASMKEINEYCCEHKLPIIEDAAQAQGTFYANNKPVGSYSNLTTFSFYPTKNLSAFGDAGCILTDNDELAKKIITIRNHGRGDEQMMGRNSRCDHIQAAVLHAKLAEVEKFNKARKEVASKYFEALRDGDFDLVDESYTKLSSWHLFPIIFEKTEQKRKAAAKLKENDIGHAPFYDRALGQEPALSHFEGEQKVACDIAGRFLCLPINPFISDDDINEVAKLLKSL